MEIGDAYEKIVDYFYKKETSVICKGKNRTW